MVRLKPAIIGPVLIAMSFQSLSDSGLQTTNIEWANNPVYSDPKDWRLQPQYRDHWIRADQCFQKAKFECAIDELQPLLEMNLKPNHLNQVERALGWNYQRLGFRSSVRNPEEAIFNFKRALEYAADAVAKAEAMTLLIQELSAMKRWEECINHDPQIVIGSTPASDLSGHSLMHLALCHYHGGSAERAGILIACARQAESRHGELLSLSWNWLEAHFITEEQPRFSCSREPPAEDWKSVAPYAKTWSIARDCHERRDHECVIRELKQLLKRDLNLDKRAETRRFLARAHDLAAFNASDDLTLRTAHYKQAFSLRQANPEDRNRYPSGLLHFLRYQEHWEKCTETANEAFAKGSASAPSRGELIHEAYMVTADCYSKTGNHQMAQRWIERARASARWQGTFVRQSWSQLITDTENELQ